MAFIEALAGALLGLVALWLVLRPLVRPMPYARPVFEPIDEEETPKGIALAALKEIEFDRETGKLSDVDYEMLKAKYTAAALEALRAADREVFALEMPVSMDSSYRGNASPGAAACPKCGPRPEPDALFCSACGRALPRPVAA